MPLHLVAGSTLTVLARGDIESVCTLTHRKSSLIYILSSQKIAKGQTILADHILDQCGDSEVDAPVTGFVKFSEHNHPANCYFLVQHLKQVAWIVDQTPELLNGDTWESREHEYWVHMKNFPEPCFLTSEDPRLLKHIFRSNVSQLAPKELVSSMPIEHSKLYSAMQNLPSGEGDVNQIYEISSYHPALSCSYLTPNLS